MFNPFSITSIKKMRDRALRQARQHIDPQSLQFRLTMGATLVTFLGMGSVSGWISWRTEQILIGSHKEAVHAIAKRVPQDVEAYVYEDMLTLEEAAQQAITVRSLPDVSLVLADVDGRIKAQPKREWHPEVVMRSLTQQNMLLPTPSVVTLDGNHYVVCTQPLKIEGQFLGILHIARDITDERVMFYQLMRTLVIITTLAMGIMAVVIAFYVRRSLRPLRQMSQMTATSSVEELAHAQLKLGHAPTEVKELAATCETALTRLASSLEKQQQFVRDISHELRTPLSIVSGYLQSLLRRKQMLTELQQEALETAASEADHTIRLLQDLLDLERAESGHIPFNLSTVVVNDLVEDVLRMAVVSSYRDIQLETASSEPVMAEVDPDYLKQVLSQLVDNALKYSEPDEPVTIRLDQIEARVIIQVCDRGVGIPLQHQARIFDQCYRVDSNRSRSTGGCGIGLSLVKVLVEGMGGTVTVRSKPEEGSIFTVTLPASPNHHDHTDRNRGRRRKASSIHRNGAGL